MLDYKTRNAYIGWLPFHLSSLRESWGEEVITW